MVDIVTGRYKELPRGRMNTRGQMNNKGTEIPAPRRHPAGGGYPRGEEARSRIIRVAIEAFGMRGFEGASTRTIAEMAGVSAPALQIISEESSAYTSLARTLSPPQ